VVEGRVCPSEVDDKGDEEADDARGEDGVDELEGDRAGGVVALVRANE